MPRCCYDGSYIPPKDLMPDEERAERLRALQDDIREAVAEFLAKDEGYCETPDDEVVG